MTKRLSFSDFLKEEKQTVYFTFGRMNPPTAGHEKMIDRLAEMADKSPYRIYLSRSHDNKKNPLLYEDKLKMARNMFSKHGRAIRDDSSVKNILEAAVALYDDGFQNIVMACGSDRVHEFSERLNLYNGKKGRHGFYMFENVKVVSVGSRNSAKSTVAGISATDLREAASKSDFVSFSQGLPKSTTNEEAKKIFNKVRVGLNLSEERSFRSHITMGTTSEIREQYIKGELFKEGDDVVIKESQEVATIIGLGANYVIIEDINGKRIRKWLDDVETLN